MLKDVMIEIFGTYEPQVYLDELSNPVIASGAAGVDWAWIAGVLLFGIVLYSLFRLLGVIFK